MVVLPEFLRVGEAVDLIMVLQNGLDLVFYKVFRENAVFGEEFVVFLKSLGSLGEVCRKRFDSRFFIVAHGVEVLVNGAKAVRIWVRFVYDSVHGSQNDGGKGEIRVGCSIWGAKLETFLLWPGCVGGNSYDGAAVGRAEADVYRGLVAGYEAFV